MAALYAADDWLALPFIQADQPQWRLYACKCSYWSANSSHSVINDHESANDPNLPWACAGHPVPQLPVKLDELTLSDDSDAAKWVEQILGGARPRPLGEKNEGPAMWLAWLYSYLFGLPAASALSSAIAARLDDPDPQVVGRVLRFFKAFPRAEGVERLVSRAESAVDRVAVGYPIPEAIYGPNLWDVLVAFRRSRSESNPLDTRAAEVVRKILVLPLASLAHEQVGPSSLDLEKQQRAKSGWSEADLARTDLMIYAKSETDVVRKTLDDLSYSNVFDEDDLLWVAEHAAEIEAAAPGRWRSIMTLLVYRHRGNTDLAHIVVIGGIALIESGAVDPAAFGEWMKKIAYDVDEWVPPLEVSLEKQIRKSHSN